MNLSNLSSSAFVNRHIGPNAEQEKEMLRVIGVGSREELISKTVPASIRLKKAMDLPQAQTEHEFLTSFRAIAQKNQIYRSFIGMGYYNTFVPNVILRNILENPGWYTAYTPYQAEIAQGRLEALINFQTMVIDLTGMEIANASLLDEATAAGEAMHMMEAIKSPAKKDAHKLFVSELLHPQTIDLLVTRCTPIGIELIVGDHRQFDLTDPGLMGVMVQYPATDGSVIDYTDFIASAKENEVLVAVAADLLSLTLLTSPGEMGADIVFGTSQRLGVPMGFGGPHAAYFATKDAYKRQMPGRIIGVSIDSNGNKAYRMSLQTREQHIRREKATSNICTAQVLLSVMAGAYAVYHGPAGLKQISTRVHGYTCQLAEALGSMGFKSGDEAFFDTITVSISDSNLLKAKAEAKKINFRYYADSKKVGISLDETTSPADLEAIIASFSEAFGAKAASINQNPGTSIKGRLLRTSEYLTHPTFNSYHAEHEMLRYLKRLENKDLSMVHSMISLGSCTMKLNATAEMIPVTWPEMGNIHPFVPKAQAAGYYEMIGSLEKWLCEATGFAAVSVQPNSGAQGEYAGLMVIRAYHQSRGDHHRNVALIPSSAHGTNPASAVMAGMKVVVTKCDEKGNIDFEDLRKNAELYKNDLSCLMVTYPSTHGVFEEGINDICDLIHTNGGQVYMDGANMNAQVGLTSPANIGADVCHLNLHKTFCIPHGGGGPGVGPIGVASHLAEFLPGHAVVATGGKNAIHAVSAAPFGSASILTISYAYIAMMGADGLTNATEFAILNANYIKARLSKFFPILYTGTNGFCAHEMIVDCRHFKAELGIEVEDIAKRLMDYGYHAPTVSFPVAGTLMIEPTESETKHELDKFCDALISIREEIREVENGTADRLNNVLKHAPHTAALICADEWTRPYPRTKAAFPLVWVKENKFWPSVGRIDSAFGDRNLVCSCIPIEEYANV